MTQVCPVYFPRVFMAVRQLRLTMIDSENSESTEGASSSQAKAGEENAAADSSAVGVKI